MASREDGGLRKVAAGYKYVLGVGVFTLISAGGRGSEWIQAGCTVRAPEACVAVN